MHNTLFNTQHDKMAEWLPQTLLQRVWHLSHHVNRQQGAQDTPDLVYDLLIMLVQGAQGMET